MSETKWTPGPWFVSGVRFRMNGGEWISVNRYNEAAKSDDNIACIGFDPRTGAGRRDAFLIAAAPDLYAALERAAGTLAMARERLEQAGFMQAAKDCAEDEAAARTALSRARGEST